MCLWPLFGQVSPQFIAQNNIINKRNQNMHVVMLLFHLLIFMFPCDARNASHLCVLWFITLYVNYIWTNGACHVTASCAACPQVYIDLIQSSTLCGQTQINPNRTTRSVCSISLRQHHSITHKRYVYNTLAFAIELAITAPPLSLAHCTMYAPQTQRRHT